MIYSHICPDCGEMELERKMSDPTPTKCPVCHKNILQRDYTTISFQRPVDMFQENENGGLGMHYPELGPRFVDAHTKKIPNTKAYARSQNEAIEKMARRGGKFSKA
jgi:putative FmdB family regulatory protein